MNYVLAIIINNVENNKILIEAMYNILKLLVTNKFISDSALKWILETYQHLSCLAHVIQLTVNDILTVMKTQSIHDEIIRNWKKKNKKLIDNVEFSQTLKKNCFLFFDYYLILYASFINWQDLSISIYNDEFFLEIVNQKYYEQFFQKT